MKIRVQYRYVPEVGVVLDGVWVPLAVLGELGDRPQNTELTLQEPFTVSDQDLERLLIRRGLARPQTRGGLYAGPELAGFMRNLEFPAGRPALPGEENATREQKQLDKED